MTVIPNVINNSSQMIGSILDKDSPFEIDPEIHIFPTSWMFATNKLNNSRQEEDVFWRPDDI